MRQRGMITAWCLLATCGVAVSGCATVQKHKKGKAVTPEPSFTQTEMPTVPPAAPTPPPEAQPIATRPAGTGKAARKGQVTGPVITYFGAARADGNKVEPESVKNGVPTYLSSAGSGFMIVVEAKPGESELEVARRVSAYVPNDPTVRPDLEIEATRDLGDGSPEVCDRRRPKIGGIPGINPPSFAETQKVADAINDFACRFETFIESDSSCTLGPNGDYSFLSKDTTTQFCMIVARAYGFPEGETLLTVRLRDADGNPGPTKQMRIRRPPPPKPTAK